VDEISPALTAASWSVSAEGLRLSIQVKIRVILKCVSHPGEEKDALDEFGHWNCAELETALL
jgi:hypothetical protein